MDRLHRIVGRGWRPQDCGLIDSFCDELERWTLAAVELLTESPRVSLPFPCPSCGQQFAYRTDSGGDRVRVLRVTEAGCSCSGCQAFWPPERFEWLARLLGCGTTRRATFQKVGAVHASAAKRLRSAVDSFLG